MTDATATIQTAASNGKTPPPPPAYFLSLSVENFRCFGPKQTLDLSGGNGRPAQWTVILGDNGVGKTSLLQCFATFGEQSGSDEIMIFDRAMLTFRGYKLFQSPTPRPILETTPFSIEVILSDGEKSLGGIDFRLDGFFEPVDAFFQVSISPPYCCAYGASRRMGKGSLSEILSADTAASLFDDAVTLINAEEWLLQADYGASRTTGETRKRAARRRDRIKQILIDLLPDVTDFRFVAEVEPRVRNYVEAETPYGWVPIQSLSLGYKTALTWMVDLAARLFDRYPNSTDPLAEPAVVLVDEIDLHLHPKWQRELLALLSKTFRNTQFIVTAHSPLIVQAAPNANIVVLRREGDHVVIDNEPEAVQNYRVDQILTSDLFGLESARPPQLEPMLEERKKILSKARLTQKDKARLAELEQQIGRLPTGETPQDREAMDIIHRAAELLKQQQAAQPSG